MPVLCDDGMLRPLEERLTGEPHLLWDLEFTRAATASASGLYELAYARRRPLTSSSVKRLRTPENTGGAPLALPLCRPSCCFGAARSKPWATGASKRASVNSVADPGGVISANGVLGSRSAGLSAWLSRCVVIRSLLVFERVSSGRRRATSSATSSERFTAGIALVVLQGLAILQILKK